MTTIENLSLAQIVKLVGEASRAGDHLTVADCDLVYDRYIESKVSDLAEFIDHERGEVRQAAARIAAVIRYCEAQQIVLEEVESNLEEMANLGI